MVKKTKKAKRKKNKSFIDKLKIRLLKVKDAMFDDLEEECDDQHFSLIEVLVIVFISILFGILVGYMIHYSNIYSNKKLQELITSYNNILDNYYDKVSEDDLVNSAVEGMIHSLDDPNSNYMNSNVTADFNKTVDGSFVGIGASVVFVSDKNYNQVYQLFPNSPAAKVGIEVNDFIIRVDDKDVSGISGSELSKYIMGQEGTDVKITVLRGEEKKEFIVTRSVIEVKSVFSTRYAFDEKNIGYIRLDNIAANTGKQFKKELKKLEKESIDSLIIDVRGNPGGHLSQTTDILSLFFSKKTILYKVKSKKNTVNVYSKNNEVRKYPVVILIDKGSASASEVIASCFKDNYKNATIVGTTSYGKGTVQKTVTLSTGSTIKYTIERWLTSKGKSLDKVGLEPDIEVVLDSSYFETLAIDDDNQLQKAIEVLKESN